MSRLDRIAQRRHATRTLKTVKITGNGVPIKVRVKEPGAADIWWREGLGDLVDRPEAKRERAKRRVRNARKAIRRAQWETHLEAYFGGAS